VPLLRKSAALDRKNWSRHVGRRHVQPRWLGSSPVGGNSRPPATGLRPQAEPMPRKGGKSLLPKSSETEGQGCLRGCGSEVWRFSGPRGCSIFPGNTDISGATPIEIARRWAPHRAGMDLALSQYVSGSGLLRKMRYWSGTAWPWTGKPKVRVERGGIGQQSRCCAGLPPDFPGQHGPFSGAIATGSGP
jgi:hypothetical protein